MSLFDSLLSTAQCFRLSLLVVYDAYKIVIYEVQMSNGFITFKC